MANHERRRALVLVALAAVLANASWFSATAIVPALEDDWHLTSTGAAWLVIVVQVGFVIGSVGGAVLNLPDRLQARWLIAGSAVVAGVSNVGLLMAHGLALALPIRFLVGVALAGVYAPAVRLVATHFERGRGVATGVVVGALTLGSGTPHLVRGLGHIPWQSTIGVTSGLAVLGAVSVWTVRPGPVAVPTPPLDVGAAARALAREQPLRLATMGYLGHMWELYALWSWLSAFFVAAQVHSNPGSLETGTVTFLAIGVAGLLGAVVAGRLADRLGRTAITSAAMLLSAACCLVSPLIYGAALPILVATMLVWGAAVIADSAQFSAAVTELAEPRYAGSVLALQLALGFTLTIVSIRLVPVAVDVAGWRYALLPLAIGPLLGTVAMLRLRRLPAALALADGRR
ncbi:MFS transporter [Kribbella sp. NBC_01484]|uniref:MFS transporter n=1 Tax=Kribbella sp. NBC_01484 TaxID=2903579 RepID=UPI002E35B4E6|nr:MFS transporter [Kribbella sp. NBC_01484]